MTTGRKAAIIGGGVIGGGWTARFLLNGWDVCVCDPAPDAQRKIGEVIDQARRSLPALYDRALPAEGTLTVAPTIAEAVAGADWIQESVPERLEIKHAVLTEIVAAAGEGTIIGSSTSGFKPSDLNTEGDRVIVAHPFVPVYLLPLVELVGDPARCARAADILHDLGMYPLTLRKEIDAHIADRFLEAVWREALWLVKDGIATTEEIDEAVRMGFGLRWAQMGLFETYRIGGGEAGMRHFLAQFGPALQWPWTKLMDVPDFNDELVDLVAGQSDAQSGHLSIRELERLRDDNLVAILRALKHEGSGAGRVLADHERDLNHPGVTDPLITVERQIPKSWTDYNGHMNATHYSELGAQASDRFMELIGADADYIASGKSFFTVEDRISYHQEVHAGDRISMRTEVLSGVAKKIHLMHHIDRGEVCVATIETVLVHVDLTTRRSSKPDPAVAARLQAFAKT